MIEKTQNTFKMMRKPHFVPVGPIKVCVGGRGFTCLLLAVFNILPLFLVVLFLFLLFFGFCSCFAAGFCCYVSVLNHFVSVLGHFCGWFWLFFSYFFAILQLVLIV